MRIAIFTLFFLFTSIGSFSQFRDGHIFPVMFDLTPAENMDKAEAIVYHKKVNDTTYVVDFYQKYGPLISEITYNDKTLHDKHGKSYWYNKEGKLDSIANFYEGKLNGEVKFYNDTMKIITSKYYKDGKFMYIDSLIGKNRYYADGTIGKIPGFEDADEQGIKLKDSSKQKIYTHIEIESEFPGGAVSWRNYLISKLKTPSRLQNILKKTGGGTKSVKVCFTIDTLGKTCDIFLYSSVELSADMEARKIIENSPEWKPASQNGEIVKSIKLQKITFNVTVVN